MNESSEILSIGNADYDIGKIAEELCYFIDNQRGLPVVVFLTETGVFRAHTLTKRSRNRNAVVRTLLEDTSENVVGVYTLSHYEHLMEDLRFFIKQAA